MKNHGKMSWTEYKTEGDDYVDIGEWGKDHWSTLAYIESRIIDNNGIIINANMRCNARLHRGFANVHLGQLMDGVNYPTRLQGGKEIENHDDWSCLEDMVYAKLITAEFREKNVIEKFGHMQARVKLTELGTQVSGMLRAYKAASEKHVYAKFQLSNDELAIIDKSLERI